MNWGVPNRCGLAQRQMRRLCAPLALACAALIAQPSAAQTVAASAGAQATVVEPLGLVKIQDLVFGRIAARATAGTVTVDPNTGVCTVTGTILRVGQCQFAEFAGFGVRRFTVRIAIPTTLTLTGPSGATMVVNNFTLGTAPGLVFIGGNGNGLGNGNRRYQITSNTGIFTMRVGGRLNVGANQAPGVYTATFPVTVNYQ
jgi:spore coat protein U-like protein